MVKKTITIADLAVMIKEGFDEVNGRFDELPTKFVTKEEFNRGFGTVMDETRLIKDDIKDIKSTNLSVVGILAIHEKEINILKDYVGIER